MSKISVQDYQQLARERLPFAETMGLELQSIDDDGVWMRARYSEKFLRPGGTIAGPYASLLRVTFLPVLHRLNSVNVW